MSMAGGGTGDSVSLDRGEVFTCADLERLGLWDTGGCCETCHSPERLFGFRFSDAMAPCTMVVGDGRRTRCCCTAKKALGGEVEHHMFLQNRGPRKGIVETAHRFAGTAN